MMLRPLLVIALLCVLLPFGGCTGKVSYDPADLPAMQVGKLIDWTKYLEGLGVVQAADEHFLSVKNGGKLEKASVTAGSPVKQGQIIAVVDETVRRAELEQALSNYKLAESEYARVKRMRRVAAATEQEYDRSRNEMQVRKSSLRKAKQDMEDSLLRSPVDGLLSFFAFRKGDYVPAGSRMAIVEDRTGFKVITKIPYDQAKDLAENTKAKVFAYDTMNRRTKGEGQGIEVVVTQVNITSDFDAANRDVMIRFSSHGAEGVKVGDAVLIKVAVANYPETALIAEDFVVNGNGEGGPAVITRDGEGELLYEKVTIRGRETDRVAVAGLTAGTTLVHPMNNNNGNWRDIVAKAKSKADQKRL